MNKFPLRDAFFLKAKNEGYRARSAYKLLEIQKKFRVIKRGDRVLDLGCSPGSFIQVIREIIGEKGFVLGIDLLDTERFYAKNVLTIKADVKDVTMDMIKKICGIECFNVITSDISPNICGINEVDEANRKEVYEAIKKIVRTGLKKGGNFVMKSFFTESFVSVKKDLEIMFEEVFIFKPQASRKRSSEVYIVCLKKR
jgi:23S rRNA (uridine2552-2'-O)-methyltransferase